MSGPRVEGTVPRLAYHAGPRMRSRDSERSAKATSPRRSPRRWSGWRFAPASRGGQAGDEGQQQDVHEGEGDVELDRLSHGQAEHGEGRGPPPDRGQEGPEREV